MRPNLNEQVRQKLPAAMADLVEKIPLSIRQDLVSETSEFFEPYHVTPMLIERFSPHMNEMTPLQIFREILPDNPFKKTRCQPLMGHLAAVSSDRHPRYCFYPYVPLSYLLAPQGTAPLVVLVHGSSRNAKDYRDQVCEFAERNGCFVLAPLFPMNMNTAVPDEEYKYLSGSDERFDLILLDLVDEFAAYFDVNFDRLFLFGFSGGAQFAHRFMYVHPERLSAVSVGSPGFVTLPNSNRKWWSGIADFEAIFGAPPDFDAMAKVPVQFIVGAQDNFPFEVYTPDELGMTVDEYEADYGKTRIARVERLRRAWGEYGIRSRFDRVPNTQHSLPPILSMATDFFAGLIRAPVVE